jgi:Glycosyl hydrolase catalytic core
MIYEALEKRLKDVIIPQLESGKSTRVLTFNEPDGVEQSNMPLEKVLQMWPHLAKLKCQLSSPATVHGDNEWMQGFMTDVDKNNRRLDFLAIHWYGPPNADFFKKRITEIYKKYGQKYNLLITEFAAADWSARCCEANRFSQAQVLTFMKEVIPWLEETKWIMGYAWFPFEYTLACGTSSALFNCDGSLTPLGRFYASVTNENPRGDRSITAEGVHHGPAGEVKPPVKPGAIPEAKPHEKPEPKPSNKPGAKPGAKPAINTETQPSSKPSTQPSPKASSKQDAEEKQSALGCLLCHSVFS